MSGGGDPPPVTESENLTSWQVDWSFDEVHAAFVDLWKAGVSQAELLFGGKATFDIDRNARTETAEYRGPEGGVGGISGGVADRVSLGLTGVLEDNPSPASAMGMEIGAAAVPFSDPALQLISGESVTGRPIDRKVAAAILAIDVIPFLDTGPVPSPRAASLEGDLVLASRSGWTPGRPRTRFLDPIDRPPSTTAKPPPPGLADLPEGIGAPVQANTPVEIPRPLTTREMAALTNTSGNIEFAQTYAKIGGQDKFFLTRASHTAGNKVTLGPRVPGLRLISHTHPAGYSTNPSPADYRVLRGLRQPVSRLDLASGFSRRFGYIEL